MSLWSRLYGVAWCCRTVRNYLDTLGGNLFHQIYRSPLSISGPMHPDYGLPFILRRHVQVLLELRIRYWIAVPIETVLNGEQDEIHGFVADKSGASIIRERRRGHCADE
jgi:hypothetical protein